MTTKSKQLILSFFESYAKSFVSFNVGAILDYYTYPCTVWHHHNYIFSQNEFYLNIHLLLEKYKKLRLKKAIFKFLNITEFSNNIRQVQVLWTLYNQQDEVASTFEVLYTMLIDNNQMKIFNVININETV